MNKVLILSVRPEHAINILNGNKTLELRKSVPKGFKGWVYVYVTKAIRDYKQSYYYQPKGKEEIFRLHGIIPCRFWFDEYETIRPSFYPSTKLIYEMTAETLYLLKLSNSQVSDYGKGKNLYAWHIKRLEIFDKPMQLGEFYKWNSADQWVYTSITKAPQSYMYAWVKEEGK